MVIDDELVSFLQPGPFSAIVAVCDDALIPETVRAWGTRLCEDGLAIDLCVGRASSQRLVTTLRHRDAMALAIANVTTYQALQLKGRCVAVAEADESDAQRVRAHGEAFVSGLQRAGITEEAARGALVSDVLRIRFVPDSLFNQTPGPDAGTPR